MRRNEILGSACVLASFGCLVAGYAEWWCFLLLAFFVAL